MSRSGPDFARRPRGSLPAKNRQTLLSSSSVEVCEHTTVLSLQEVSKDAQHGHREAGTGCAISSLPRDQADRGEGTDLTFPSNRHHRPGAGRGAGSGTFSQ